MGQHALVGFSDPARHGIAGTFFALFAASASVGKYYPWLLPMNLFINGRATTAIVRSAAGSIIAVVLGCLEFVRRDVISLPLTGKLRKLRPHPKVHGNGLSFQTYPLPNTI